MILVAMVMFVVAMEVAEVVVAVVVLEVVVVAALWRSSGAAPACRHDDTRDDET